MGCARRRDIALASVLGGGYDLDPPVVAARHANTISAPADEAAATVAAL